MKIRGKYRVGFFAEPGTNKWSQTHIVGNLGKLLCGSQVASQSEFQWCFSIVDWKRVSYVECDHCRRIARRLEHENKNKE